MYDKRYLDLDLFCDDDVLWRCRGRLGNADVTDNVKYHYLLLKEHRFTELVLYIHMI